MSKISLKHSGGNAVSLNSPTNAPTSADVAFKLPNADGSNGQAIVTDGSGNLSFGNVAGSSARNMIINGAFQIAQRSVSSTTTGYQTVDRFTTATTGVDEAPTFAQADVASGTTPYTLGFRKAFKITNGNQTSGAGATDRVEVMTRLEAQDIANSGWNYTSSSSFVTLSFWIKSSVAQNFFLRIQSQDGTAQRYAIETGSLSADTWTKVTKQIPGNSNLQFDNNNQEGLRISFYGFLGTDYTDSSSLNTWAASATGNRTPDNTSTWYTTNDATLEITGVQLEVGNSATDFKHRSFAEELALCQRYYYMFAPYVGYNGRSGYAGICENSTFYTQNNIFAQIEFPTTMRTTPSIVYSTGTNYYIIYRQGTSQQFDGSGVTMEAVSDEGKACINKNGTPSNAVAGDAAIWRLNANNAYMAANAEL